MIFNTKFIADWNAIKKNKQDLIVANNCKENMKRIKYKYEVNQKVLVEKRQPNKMSAHFEGPYKIMQVSTNGTVVICHATKNGAVLECINIRRIQPYIE